MKAFLLAAGEGTRLRPLTLETPKCLIPVCGRPLIEYWFDLFELYGIDEILINTSYLAEKVQSYIGKSTRKVKIVHTFEDTLLGSGGTIKKNWDFVKNEKNFFIFYADNLTNINLQEMIDFHDDKQKDITLALFRVPNPSECGIVDVDDKATVLSFTEKPDDPQSDLAFAGIMISNPRLYEIFPDKEIFDLGFDVLPRTAGKASGFIMNDYLLDIGTPEKLNKAHSDIENEVFADRTG